MKRKASAPSAASRCQYRTPSGRRCRSASSAANSHLCLRHAAREKLRGAADLSANLGTGRDAFDSAEAIHRRFADLYTLLAEGRIAPRRAAVLAYIGSLLLRARTAIERQAAEPAPQKPRIVWDIPSFGMPADVSRPAAKTPESAGNAQ